MTTKKPVIGILGGIGPEAGAEFLRRLVLAFQQSGKIRSNQDFPRMILHSVPAPELFLDAPQLEQYIFGVQELERFGADFIVMACNTVHAFLPELQEKVRVPILDLRAAVQEVLDKHAAPVVFLGTSMSNQKKLFEGKNMVFLSKEEENQLDAAIADFLVGKNREAIQTRVLELARQKQAVGQTVLAGCTEVSVMLQNSDLLLLDTLDMLVNATVKQWFFLNK